MLLITTSCNKQMARYHLTPDQGNSISLVKSVAESRNERGLVFLIYALEPYFQHPDILSIDPDNMRKEDSSEGSTIRLALEAISGHDSVNERDLSGYSPLYRSILHGNHFLVKKLLDHFPKNINKDMRFGVDGWTVLSRV